MKEFYGEFANWTDVSSNFGAGDWNNRTVKTDEPILVLVTTAEKRYGLVFAKVKGKTVCVSASPELRWCVWKSPAALKEVWRTLGWHAQIVDVEKA